MRLLLVALMLISLLMSVAIPKAFGEGGLMFALAYATIQVGRTTFVVLVLERSSMLGRNFQRILAWFTIPAVLWVAGSLLQSEARYVLGTIALVLEYMGAGGRLLDAGSRTLHHRRLDGRRWALRRALPVVRYPRPWGVDPGDRHDLWRDRSVHGHGIGVRGRLCGQRGDVVALLLPQLGGRSQDVLLL